MSYFLLIYVLLCSIHILLIIVFYHNACDFQKWQHMVKNNDCYGKYQSNQTYCRISVPAESPLVNVFYESTPCCYASYLPGGRTPGQSRMAVSKAAQSQAKRHKEHVQSSKSHCQVGHSYVIEWLSGHICFVTKKEKPNWNSHRILGNFSYG